MTRGRAIAILSGKGGSGKTMISATVANMLLDNNHNVILVDADIGTGGLSYYLGLKLVNNTRGGLAAYAFGRDRLESTTESDKVDSLLQEIHFLRQFRYMPESRARLLPLGDHRRISRELSRPVHERSGTRIDFARTLQDLILDLRGDADPPHDDSQSDDQGSTSAQSEKSEKNAGSPDVEHSFFIVDCRGGIDEDSIAVCNVVDDIILVVEPDTTSFEASRHLVEALTDYQLDTKLRGFIINKVFDDPTYVARSGTSVFGAQYLGAIPFDADATRAFLVGNIPNPYSIFSTQLTYAFHSAYPRAVDQPSRSRWTPDDYASVSLSTSYSKRAGLLLGLLVLIVGASIGVNILSGLLITRNFLAISVAALSLLGFFASFEPVREIVGRSLRPRRTRYNSKRTFKY